MSQELRAVVTAANEPEASMVCQLLAQAGVGAVAKPSGGIGIGWNGGGPLTIYVEGTI
jgi:hypothetical protein